MTSDQAARRRWMGVLAKARLAELEAAWAGLDDRPTYTWLRRPEVGLVMVRGRAGGTGTRFNLGEMTVTRCALRVEGGSVGFGYVQGRDGVHVELAAAFDALMQTPERHDKIEREIIAPLEASQAARRQDRSRKANATKVEFFTMVRGEDVR
ncbi:MAG: phosphonate C-P lyase system protein PhnG [Alphaproteobacteria bacterium]|jgi:alpha-D-ribose 1-methylphosphonate 5-triphosphate synthase subunit PhnG|nr:phosphonate C-P lyase system protein PhnG [Alphaproteobacteria bacterium]